MINRLPMNTHSYKVNKYEPFKTHQEKFLETFQMKIEQNTHGKRGAQASSRCLCYFNSSLLSVEPVKCEGLELLLQDRAHDLKSLLHFFLFCNHSVHCGPEPKTQLIFIRVRNFRSEAVDSTDKPLGIMLNSIVLLCLPSLARI